MSMNEKEFLKEIEQMLREIHGKYVDPNKLLGIILKIRIRRKADLK